MSSSLKPHCQICGSREHLLRCSGCKVVSYCDKEHQAADWLQHKERCKEVKKNRQKLEHEETKLRAMPADMFLPQPIFEKGIGHFWGMIDTRDYMRARCALVRSVVPAATFEAISLALEHSMDMLRLSRSDNVGMRFLIPSFLLRLGKEQKCYDFIKWWATIDGDGEYDWGDTDLPFMDINDADVFEPVDHFCRKYSNVSETFAITLLKVKLLLDLKSLQRSPGGNDAIGTSLIQCKKDILRGEDFQILIEKLEHQVQQLYKSIKSANVNLWPAFLDPEPHLRAELPYYSPGDISEARMVLRNIYAAWTETQGAVDVVQHLIAQDQDFGSHL